jgi:hypothetical protein
MLSASASLCEDQDDEREGHRPKRPRIEDNVARPPRADSTGMQHTVRALNFKG